MFLVVPAVQNQYPPEGRGSPIEFFASSTREMGALCCQGSVLFTYSTADVGGSSSVLGGGQSKAIALATFRSAITSFSCQLLQSLLPQCSLLAGRVSANQFL